MTRLIVLLEIAIIISFASSPVYSADVYKWVDADGITYYADEAPPFSPYPVSLIELTGTDSITVDPEKDFYSIANQWRRFHKERIEREKLKIERAKLEGTQQPKPLKLGTSMSRKIISVLLLIPERSITGMATIGFTNEASITTQVCTRIVCRTVGRIEYEAESSVWILISIQKGIDKPGYAPLKIPGLKDSHTEFGFRVKTPTSGYHHLAELLASVHA